MQPNYAKTGEGMNKKERIIADFNDGVSIRQIAESVEMSEYLVTQVIKAEQKEYKSKQRLDKKDIEKAVQMVKDGFTFAQARKATGLSIGSIGKYAAGLSLNKIKKKKLLDSDIDLAMDLWRGGMSCKEIAKKFEVHPVTMMIYLRKYSDYRQKKLTEEEISEIKMRYLNGESVASLSILFKRSRSVVWYHTAKKDPNKKSLLTMSKAREIRKLAADGENLEKLSLIYGVKVRQIKEIILNKAWREIND
jgi:transposase